MIDLVSKPVDQEQLVAVILRHLRRRPAKRDVPAESATRQTRFDLIDLPELHARWAGSEGTVERLLRAFVDSCDSSASELDRAIGSGDLEQIAFVGHSLRSALASIAATHAAQLAADVQHAAKTGRADALQLADRLACELRLLKTEASQLAADSALPSAASDAFAGRR